MAWSGFYVAVSQKIVLSNFLQRNLNSEENNSIVMDAQE